MKANESGAQAVRRLRKASERKRKGKSFHFLSQNELYQGVMATPWQKIIALAAGAQQQRMRYVVSAWGNPRIGRQIVEPINHDHRNIAQISFFWKKMLSTDDATETKRYR